MSSYMIRGLPPGLIARARQQARNAQTTLDTVLRDFLGAYADGRAPQQVASQGGHARAAALSGEERREIARRAALTRWRQTAKS